MSCPREASLHSKHHTQQIPHTTIRLASTKTTNPTNERIRFNSVRLVDEETGQLGPPQQLTTILKSIERKHQLVELVAEKPEPIVKIRDTREMYKKAREQKVSKAGDTKEKEIQMSWGLAETDFERKLNKAREELERGNSVDLTFARKKGQPFLTPDEMKSQVQRAVDALADISKESGGRTIRQHTATVALRSTVEITKPGESPLDKLPTRKAAAQARKERALQRELKKTKEQSTNTDPEPSSLSLLD